MLKSVHGKNRRQSWQVPASSFAKNTRNRIREIVENLNICPNPDKQLIALSIGDPTIFGNLNPAPEVIQALQDSVRCMQYNGYAPGSGYDEAKEAVAEYSSIDGVTVDPKSVILCSGCSSALDLCITVIADRGQNILVPTPGFGIYRTLGEGIGIQFRSYNLLPKKGWEVDLNHLESQIDCKTAAIIVINPSNPCGSVYSKKHLQEILDVAARNYVPIIADEIYERLVFPGEKFTSLASLSVNVPILSCSGTTKRFLTPGWRMGWIIIHDRNNVLSKEIRKGLQNLTQRTLGSNTIVQGALKWILKNTPEKFYNDVITVIHDNAVLAYRMLSQVDGLTPIMPQGAMYIMVGIDMKHFSEFESDLTLVQQLVTEESVFCLPGDCFNYPGYMRLVLTIPLQLLEEACKRITEFCERHYRKYTDCI